MPHASDLEEFGLEVERENHALITPPTRTTRAGGSVLPLTTPTKEQRTLLQSSNSRTFIQQRGGSGILKWTILLLALTMAVFLHLQQESDTTQYVEQTLLLADVEECIDDPEFSLMLKSEKNCASYVANVGRKPLLESRCSSPIGIPDEDGFQKLLKHFCRKSCGLCGTDDTISQDESDEEIEEEVHVIAEEIEEKELEEEIEKELEEEIELEKELEEQEKEMMNDDGADENEEEDGAEDGVDMEEDGGVDGNVQEEEEEAVPSDEEDSDNEGGDNVANGEEDGEGSDVIQSSDIAEEEFVGVAPAEEGGESTIVEQGDNNSTESYIGDVPMAVEEPNDAGGESDAPAEDANDYVAEVKNDTVVVVVMTWKKKHLL